MFTVQLLPADTAAPLILSVSEKSPGFGPANVMPFTAMFSTAVPAFVTVMGSGALLAPTVVLGNVRLPGTSVTAGAGANPDPFSGANWSSSAAFYRLP